MSRTNDEYAAIASALAAELSKKTKAELVTICANAAIRQMIHDEADGDFVAKLAHEHASEKSTLREEKAELAAQAMRALELNWQAIADLQSDLSAAPKKMAKLGGDTRAARINATKGFALDLYRARTWRSARQAAKTIWPAVEAEAAQRYEWKMSADTGPQTLYGWLLESNKEQKA